MHLLLCFTYLGNKVNMVLVPIFNQIIALQFLLVNNFKFTFRKIFIRNRLFHTAQILTCQLHGYFIIRISTLNSIITHNIWHLMSAELINLTILLRLQAFGIVPHLLQTFDNGIEQVLVLITLAEQILVLDELVGN